jgi:hypothetical protein
MVKKPVPARDRIGQKINLLTILEIKYQNRKSDGQKEALAVCKCDCGKIKTINLNAIVTPRGTKSCGCLPTGDKKGSLASNYRHGMTQSRAWKLWNSMKRRCYTVGASGYFKYGARGVTVCDKWKNSFEEFYKDMGDPPLGMSIDRIDNSKGYSKENCKWSTLKEQANNKTSNIFFTIDGDTKTLAQWVDIYKPFYGIKYATVQNRIYRNWDIKTALITPLLDPKKPELYLKKSKK